MAIFHVDVEKAIYKALDGNLTVWKNKEKTERTPIPVFMAPPEREYKTVKWPSISVWLIDNEHDIGRETHQTRTGIVCPVEGKENTVNVRQVPTAFDMIYQLDLYSRYASHDRDLVKQLWTIFPPRTYIDVLDTGNLTNGQPTVNRMWMFLEGFNHMDEFQGTQSRIFHKVWTWKIKAVLDADPGIEKTTAYDGLTLGKPTDLTKDSTGLNIIKEN